MPGPVFVEGKSVTNAVGVATTAAFTNAFALGQLVVVTVGYSQGANETTSVVDNASTSNTYTVIPSASLANTGNILDLAVYYSVITHAKASPTVTVNFNSSATNASVVVQYFNGFVGTPTLDQAKAASGTGSTSLSSGASSATGHSTELVLGMAMAGGTAGSFTLGSGYTNLNTALQTSNYAAMESKIVSSTGAQTATFSVGSTANWLCSVATFYDAGAGGTPTNLFFPFMG